MILGSNSTVRLNKGIGQTPASTNAGDTSTEIVAANASRTSVFLTNIGKENVWLSCDAAALLDKGLFLGKNGGAILLDATSFTIGPINGICTSGKSSTVVYQETNR